MKVVGPIFATALLLATTCSLVIAQDRQEDSLRNVITISTDPVQRFAAIVKLLEYEDNAQVAGIDSSLCAELLKIAQQQRSDGMLATSYNWIGYWLYSTKGDNTTALEYYFKALPLARNVNDKRRISSLHFDIAGTYFLMDDLETFLKQTKLGGENLPDVSSPKYNHMLVQFERNMSTYYTTVGKWDSALFYTQAFARSADRSGTLNFRIQATVSNAYVQSRLGNMQLADNYFTKAKGMTDSIKDPQRMGNFYKRYIPFLVSSNRIEEAKLQSTQMWARSTESNNANFKLMAARTKRDLFDKLNQPDSAYYYSKVEAATKDLIFSRNNQNIIQALAFKEQLRSIDDEAKKAAYQSQLRQFILLAALTAFLIVALVLYRNNLVRKKANQLLHRQKSEIELQKKNAEEAWASLRTTQAQLIQSEKMASLGELTAGIAHEIQNPLNFVNNFSEVNAELISEMKAELAKGNIEAAKSIADTISENETKIVSHGKRADAIVKGMLQHSRSSSGVKEPTEINSLADEYLRLAYHGLRAKDKTFNATMKTEFDASIGTINVIPQDMGRVILNLITNAFYAVSDKAKTHGKEYQPTVVVATTRTSHGVEIRVKDNGGGIPQHVRDKIFHPFFTTKPTGQGTGLGLSLSYDIVKAHGGELKVETKEGEGSEFVITLVISDPRD